MIPFPYGFRNPDGEANPVISELCGAGTSFCDVVDTDTVVGSQVRLHISTFVP